MIILVNLYKLQKFYVTISVNTLRNECCGERADSKIFALIYILIRQAEQQIASKQLRIHLVRSLIFILLITEI